MKRNLRWFALIVAAQALFLLGWAGYHESVRQYAPVLRLHGRPADPRDLLRGDYMTLRYDIGQASIEGISANSDHGDVWVLLEPRNGYHVVARASRERLNPGPNQVLVRGSLAYRFGSLANGQRPIDYGIEQYFVPEGRGSPRFQTIEVEAAVSPDHRLYIRRVLLDGKAYP